jgi:TRAP-type uncharacterized transport system fused permease subunit
MSTPDSAQSQDLLPDAELQLPARSLSPGDGLPEGFGEGLPGRVAFWIAFTFTAFQLWSAAYGALPSQVVRAMHVGFLLLLGFALLANLRARARWARLTLWSLGVAGFGIGVYNWANYVPLLQRTGFLTSLDLIVGTALLVLVFEGARRFMGLPLAVIAGIFLAYCFFGQYMPGALVHRGYDYEQIIEHMAFGTE